MKRIIVFATTLVALSGCGLGSHDSPIATVDIARISANWPKFINYNNQIASDTEAIRRSNASAQDKQRQLDDLRKKFAAMQNEVTNDVRTAAEQVAAHRHFKLILTHEFVGYGGTDITPDVEKILQITEASPPPSK